MLVRLTEICGTGAVTTGRRYSLREVFVDKEHRFSKITIDKGTTGTEITVIGDPDAVETALNKRNYILKG